MKFAYPPERWMFRLGLRATKNIYTDYASDFYKMDDNLENYSSTMKNVTPIKENRGGKQKT